MDRFIKTVALLLFTCTALWGAPDRVIIIVEGRSVSDESPYGTFPLSPNGPLLNESLNALGQIRAASLVERIYPNEKFVWIGTYEGNNKAIQTLLPLANAHFPKDAPTSVYSYSAPSIQEVSPYHLQKLKKTLNTLDGGNVILCWKRDEIPLLLQELQLFDPLFLDY